MEGMVKIPAEVVKAAALFTSKSREPRDKALHNVRIVCNEHGHWNISSTDSFRLFDAWEGCTNKNDDACFVISLDDFVKDIKPSDSYVLIKVPQEGDDCVNVYIKDRKQNLRLERRALVFESRTFPNVDVFELKSYDFGEVMDYGFTLNPSFLQDVCKASKLLDKTNTLRVSFRDKSVRVGKGTELPMPIFDLVSPHGKWNARCLVMPKHK